MSDPIQASDLMDTEEIQEKFNILTKNLQVLSFRWKAVEKASKDATEAYQELQKLLKGK